MSTVLAINGGVKSVSGSNDDLFHWPIVTEEDEQAVLEVLRGGTMSDIDITMKLEEEISQWLGLKYVLGHPNGTSALQSAMYGCHVGVGTEIIGPSVTYWATVLPALSLGSSIVFADIEEHTLCIDPEDIEHRITDRTRLIVVNHNYGMPCKMDRIMEIADRHHIRVLEDLSHAQGGYYQGQMLGTFGHVTAFSCMGRKSMAWGEAGMLATNDREIYERAIAFGSYIRHNDENLTIPELNKYKGLPRGGVKNRMNQTCAAMGRVQLRHYDRRIAEIQKAMNYFWDLLDDVPGIRAHRTEKDSGSTMGGWYCPAGLYRPEELGGLSVEDFCEAVQAEGVPVSPGCNFPLHLHPLFHDCDIYGHGKPTTVANSDHDVRQGKGGLPVSERILKRCFFIPWFKHHWPENIKQYADGIRKVCENSNALTSKREETSVLHEEQKVIL